MNSSAQSVEQISALTDMADGLCCRLYHLKGALITKTRPLCLSDGDLSKVRTKLEKKFPSMPDPQKIAGWELLVEGAANVMDQLNDSFDLYMDVIEFASASKKLLQEVALNINEFKLSRNRRLMIYYLDLVVCYIRVMKMFEMSEDRLSVVALYLAACGIVQSSASELAQSSDRKDRFHALNSDIVDLNRHFIDVFAPALAVIPPLLLQLRGSLILMRDCEDLRKNGVINPINEGDKMGMPSIDPLNATVNVSAYTELASIEKYYEYVVYGLIAFPALLYQPECFELLTITTSARLFVELWRDININIHLEFEKISAIFPNASDHVTVPRGVKLKSLLKQQSRASVSTVGLQQKARRSFLFAELTSLNRLLTAAPGLLAPKLPMLLAATSLAKHELVAYFRHAEGCVVRKDSKAYYDASHFYCEDIATLMHQLVLTRQLLEKYHAEIVLPYYVEYLTVNDLKALRALRAQCGSALDLVKPQLNALVSDLEYLRAHSSPQQQQQQQQQGEDGASLSLALEGFRMNWDRVLVLYCSQGMSTTRKALGDSFESLCERMQYICERTTYVDSLKELITRSVNYHEIGWFRAVLLAAFGSSMTNPHGLARFSFCFFVPLECARLSCHAECPEEVLELSEKAAVVSNTMMNDLGAFVVTLVKFLWDNISTLEAQYHPIEVGKRIERSLHTRQQLRGQTEAAKSAAAAAVQEALPGCESEVWAKKQIERFVLIQQHLTWLVTAAVSKGLFQVHNLEYNPALYIQEQIISYFESRLRNEVFYKSSYLGNNRPQERRGSSSNSSAAAEGLSVTEQLERFSVAYHRLTSGCRAMQFVLRLMNVDVGSTVKALFYREFQDPALIPPPGLPVPLYTDLDKEKLIYKLGQWFTDMVKQIARPGSELVWAPAQRVFVNASKEMGVNSDFPVDMFLNQSEFVQLLTLLGVQGMRAIESQLLTLLSEELTCVVRFLRENKSYLRELESTYCLSIVSAEKCAKLDALFDAMRTIGVILALRESLHAATGECYSLRFGDMRSAVEEAVRALDFYSDAELGTPLACLAADLGITGTAGAGGGAANGAEDRDVALCAALARLNLAAEKDALMLFPIAIAALFVAPQWQKSVYLPKLEAFSNNEHLIQLALWKLSSSFFILAGAAAGTSEGVSGAGDGNAPEGESHNSEGDDGTAAGATASGMSNTTVDESVAVNHQMLVRNRYKHYVERYVAVAAQILLIRREADIPVNSTPHPPYRAMSTMLDTFVAMCPALVRGTLEKYLPHALLHADLVDISLGKQRIMDKMSSFTHPVYTSLSSNDAVAAAAGGATTAAGINATNNTNTGEGVAAGDEI